VSNAGQVIAVTEGDRVRIVSSTSGRVWTGKVTNVLKGGGVQLLHDDSTPTRYYPASWVDAVIEACEKGEPK